MKIFGLFLALFAASLCLAGKLQDQLNARWKGAWVVISSESYSNCDARYTNNQVSNKRVSGPGHRFLPGELGKIKKVDVKRARVDVLLDLAEPLLIPYQDGPFQLYNRTGCLLELRFSVARELVKTKDVTAIEDQLALVLVRFPNREEAVNSPAWNERVTEPFPDDYEQTLAEYRAWKAEQHNRAVQKRIDEAIRISAGITHRVSGNPEYALGLVQGMKRMHDAYFGECDQILNAKFQSYRKRPPKGKTETWAEGFEDGQYLAFLIEIADRLSGCFIELP